MDGVQRSPVFSLGLLAAGQVDYAKQESKSGGMTTAYAQRDLPTRGNFTKLLTLAAVLGFGASLAACGAQAPVDPATTSGTSSTTASETASETASPETSSAAASTAGPTNATEAATTAPETSSPASSAPTNQPPSLCTAASLTGALDDSGGGAAGHLYMKLVLTNSSSSDCIVDGYPGVSMVKAGTTTPIGAPAVRDAQAPSNGPIPLAPGQSAAAVLRYTQADNYQGCQRVQGDSILVYPPSAFDSLEIPRALTACSNATINLLSIGAFQP